MPEVEEPKEPEIKIAIIGRPNVGKSTLLNALTGEERAIVSPVAGTTRDSVDESLDYDGTHFVFVDTAGIRRKGKTKLMAEKLSVVMARRNIRLADIVIVVLDASEGFVALDATIAGYAHEGGRPVILVINKWDVTPTGNRKTFEQDVRDRLKFLDYAPVIFMSAINRSGIHELLDLIKRSERIGISSRHYGRVKPFRRDTPLRRAEDPLHHAGEYPATVVYSFHRQARRHAFLA